jgi:hypothetical protein
LHLYGGHKEALNKVKLPINGLWMYCVMLSLLGCISDDLDGLDTLVVLTAPIQDPHLV